MFSYTHIYIFSLKSNLNDWNLIEIKDWWLEADKLYYKSILLKIVFCLTHTASTVGSGWTYQNWNNGFWELLEEQK